MGLVKQDKKCTQRWNEDDIIVYIKLSTRRTLGPCKRPCVHSLTLTLLEWAPFRQSPSLHFGQRFNVMRFSTSVQEIYDGRNKSHHLVVHLRFQRTFYFSIEIPTAGMLHAAVISCYCVWCLRQKTETDFRKLFWSRMTKKLRVSSHS